MRATAHGTLLLVVGASGAGKDTLIEHARRHLPSGSPIAIVEREITRVCGASEHHVPISDAEFDARSERGYYVLQWRAHGVRYGIPHAARGLLERGCSVLTIASRSVLDAARDLPYPARFIEIQAPYEVLRARLCARDGRPSSEIEGRLSRASAFELHGGDVHVIDNGGALADSGAAFLRVLAQLSAA